MRTPYLSYRHDENTGRLKEPTDIKPENALEMPGNLVLLVHGYNNSREEADGAYDNFFKWQSIVGPPINQNVISVYWPGSNWEGALYYMQAVGKAKVTAKYFANDLVNAARKKGILSVNFVAHSLGNRLVYETIQEIISILKDETGPSTNIIVSSVVSMAGAVPVSMLEEDGDLRDSIEFPLKTASMYSGKDSVLHWAFPVGESLSSDLKFFPIALGRRKWDEGQSLWPPLNQTENSGAGHGDYWGGDSKNLSSLEQAARFIRKNVFLGSVLPSVVPKREVNSRIETSSRVVSETREVKSRKTKVL